MSALRDFTTQYILPRYQEGTATAVVDAEAGLANGTSQPHEPDLQVAAVKAGPMAGPVAAAGPTAPNPKAPLALPANRGLTAVEITTNGRPYAVAPGGRLYLFPMGVFAEGEPEQL